jgi:hypothetical protein
MLQEQIAFAVPRVLLLGVRGAWNRAGAVNTQKCPGVHGFQGISCCARRGTRSAIFSAMTSSQFRDFILGAVATAGGRNKHEKPLPARMQ